MIKADQHTHSLFSPDSSASVESMINAAAAKGLDTLCLTDHYEFGLEESSFFDVNQMKDTRAYTRELLKYTSSDKINLNVGIEIGLQPECAQQAAKIAEDKNLDFVIGSSHAVDFIDPSSPRYFDGLTSHQAYYKYFDHILRNISACDCFDVYGHLDYVVRYSPHPVSGYRPADFREIIEALLKVIISKGKGIEINTAGVRKKLKYPHPHKDILKMYKELGGEIITVGSDAHCPEDIACDFDAAEQLLRDCGFNYYCVFKQRKPLFRNF